MVVVFEGKSPNTSETSRLVKYYNLAGINIEIIVWITPLTQDAIVAN